MTAQAPAQVRLADRYAAVVCDLDGVVYRGSEPVPYAVAALAEARAWVSVVFATNNASRTAAVVADQLTSLGLPSTAADVVTSAQVGAALLAEHLPAGSAVLAVGGPGVDAALREAQLKPVREEADGIPAVLQGWGSQVCVADLARASIVVARGAWWVATNTDRTLPTERGDVPGNGTLVDAVRTATGREPTVVGKPFAPLYLAAAARSGQDPTRTLGVGDRLDTDIVGARAAGMDSLWVLTGVDGLAQLAHSTARPTYAAWDLRGLGHPLRQVDRDAAGWSCANWRISLTPRGVVSIGCATASPTPSQTRNTLLQLVVRVLCDVRDDYHLDAVDLERVTRDLEVIARTGRGDAAGSSVGVSAH
jgi:HAD superfamily hydrolase (TIGR01450 family)